MTAIVGFTDKKNNTTWIGSDSLGSNGFSKAVQANPKCFHNDTLKNVIMGSTSTFRHISQLHILLKPFTHFSPLHKFPQICFLKAIPFYTNETPLNTPILITSLKELCSEML